MTIYEICVWCSGGMIGNTSIYYGLCSTCRKSKEGKKYISEYHKNKVENYEENNNSQDKLRELERWSTIQDKIKKLCEQ